MPTSDGALGPIELLERKREMKDEEKRVKALQSGVKSIESTKILAEKSVFDSDTTSDEESNSKRE